MIRRPPRSTRTDTLFPYTTLFRSARLPVFVVGQQRIDRDAELAPGGAATGQHDQPAVAEDFVVAELARAAVAFPEVVVDERSEEHRVGKACVGTCRSRWSPDH